MWIQDWGLERAPKPVFLALQTLNSVTGNELLGVKT
jgi:hypothetical protein